MAHLFELAVSGRSKCRGCGQVIRRGELRFGECLPNLFGEGDMTIWFHPRCAAYKRPQALLQGLAEARESIDGREGLERDALQGIAQRRLPRIAGAERAATGQARCRSCRQPIERQSWRIRLSFYEEGRFAAGGFVHLGCCNAYFETDQVLARLLQFSPELNDDERQELTRACAGPA